MAAFELTVYLDERGIWVEAFDGSLSERRLVPLESEPLYAREYHHLLRLLADAADEVASALLRRPAWERETPLD